MTRHLLPLLSAAQEFNHFIESTMAPPTVVIPPGVPNAITFRTSAPLWERQFLQIRHQMMH